MKSWKIKDGLNKTWIMSNSLYFVLCIDIKKKNIRKNPSQQEKN